MDFTGLLVMLFIWLVFGGMASKAKQAKNKGTSPTKAAAARTGADTGDKKKNAAAPAVPEANHRGPIAPTVAYGSHDDSIYQGSLNAVTGEGYDPCHESDLRTLNEAEDRKSVV